MRTLANKGIFHIKSAMDLTFQRLLHSEGFIDIQTPKRLSVSSVGGLAVLELAQSPQLHKQMAICGDFGRVFEVGPVFRAEDSFTYRHLCEFTGLDVEMEIMEHYSEVMDIVDWLFVAMFDHLNENCKEHLEDVRKQYPFEDLKYLRKTLRLTFQEGVEMLKGAGIEVDPLGEFNTEAKRKLGELVKEKYKTEFYIIHRCPSAGKPFYAMPCYDDAAYSNSFDVFIRGEEIISGGQHVHIPELIIAQAESKGIDVNKISTYVDSFRYGAPLHGGFEAVSERVVMLFCGLGNIPLETIFALV